MKTYRVRWEVDVDAETPREAAIAAMRLQGEHTTANVFRVTEPRDHLFWDDGEEIDLGDEPRHLIPLDTEAEEGV